MELKGAPEWKRNLEILPSGTCPRPHSKLVSPQTVEIKGTCEAPMGEFGKERWTPCCQALETQKVLYSSKDLKNDSWSGGGGGGGYDIF